MAQWMAKAYLLQDDLLNLQCMMMCLAMTWAWNLVDTSFPSVRNSETVHARVSTSSII